MQTINTRAVLTFANDAFHKASFSIPRARMDISAADAKAAMTTMLASGALEHRSLGTLHEAKGARLVKTTRTRLV